MKNYQRREKKKPSSEVHEKKHGFGNICVTKDVLDEYQKEAYEALKTYPYVTLIGQGGSGKTNLAVIYAIEQLLAGKYETIYITRPTVSSNRTDIGFLPGSLEDKLEPWMIPIYQNMYRMMGKQMTEKFLAEGKIQIIPFAFMRGVTFSNAVVISDESQNITIEQAKMLVSRLGNFSQMILTGDLNQIDLKNKYDSGLKLIVSLNFEGHKVVILKGQHRNKHVTKWMKLFDMFECYSEEEKRKILDRATESIENKGDELCGKE